MKHVSVMATYNNAPSPFDVKAWVWQVEVSCAASGEVLLTHDTDVPDLNNAIGWLRATQPSWYVSKVEQKRAHEPQPHVVVG